MKDKLTSNFELLSHVNFKLYERDSQNVNQMILEYIIIINDNNSLF